MVKDISKEWFKNRITDIYDDYCELFVARNKFMDAFKRIGSQVNGLYTDITLNIFDETEAKDSFLFELIDVPIEGIAYKEWCSWVEDSRWDLDGLMSKVYEIDEEVRNHLADKLWEIPYLAKALEGTVEE